MNQHVVVHVERSKWNHAWKWLSTLFYCDIFPAITRPRCSDEEKARKHGEYNAGIYVYMCQSLLKINHATWFGRNWRALSNTVRQYSEPPTLCINWVWPVGKRGSPWRTCDSSVVIATHKHTNDDTMRMPKERKKLRKKKEKGEKYIRVMMISNGKVFRKRKIERITSRVFFIIIWYMVLFTLMPWKRAKALSGLSARNVRIVLNAWILPPPKSEAT